MSTLYGHDFSRPLLDEHGLAVEVCANCGRSWEEVADMVGLDCSRYPPRIGTQLRIRLPKDYRVIQTAADFNAATLSAMWWPPVVDDETSAATEVPAPAPEPKRLTLGEKWIRDWGRGPVW